MKNLTLSVVALSAITVGICFSDLCPFCCSSENNEVSEQLADRKPTHFNDSSQFKKEKKEIKVFQEMYHMMRADANGEVKRSDVMKARQQMKARRQNGGTRAVSLSWEQVGPDEQGGRTRAVHFDINNPSRMYAAGVSGGLFWSDNSGLSWTEHPDNTQFGHLGISAIAQAPNGDIYVGTGEDFPGAINDGTNHGNASFIGEGIWKSSDNGQTFQHLLATKPTVENSESDPWVYVNELAVSPNNSDHVFAATTGGLMISVDGGQSWTDADIDVGTNNNSREVAVGTNGVVYAHIGVNYFRSTNGVVFTRMSGTGGFPSGQTRIDFGVSPVDANYVYALCLSGPGFGNLQGVYESTDAGLTWTTIALESPTFNPLGNQGGYDMVLGNDGAQADRIFVGGQLSFWSYSGTDGWNQLASWAPESPTNPYFVHADMHDVKVHPNNPDILFVASDGGLSASMNAQNKYPTFVTRNKGYITTQFYGIDAHSSGYILGGTQDNGTRLVDFTGNTRNESREVQGGDGGFCNFSKLKNGAMFAEVTDGEVRRTSSLNGSFFGFFDENIDSDANGVPDDFCLFISPFDLFERAAVNGFPDSTILGQDRAVFILGCNGRIWVCNDALNFGIVPSWYRMTGISGTVTAIDASDEQYVYVGTSNGNLYRFDGFYDVDFSNSNPGGSVAGVSRVPIGSFSGRYITGIGVDPNNAENVVVTLGSYTSGSHVHRSSNAASATSVVTAAFASIQGDLPEMPVYDAVIDYNNNNVVVVGTELGMWATDNNGTTWTEQNNGMPSVPVFSVIQEGLYDDNCPVIYIGTMGRGFFRSTTLTPSACNTVAGIENNNGSSYVAAISDFQVYPNPVFDRAIVEFSLSHPEKETKIFATDMFGKVVKQFEVEGAKLTGNRLELDFSDVSSGIYLLAVQTGNTVETRRVIVTK